MKKIYVIGCIFLGVSFQYCSSAKKSTGADPKGNVKLTYVSNVQPLISTHCSPCHIPPKGSKLALDNYAAARENIADVIHRINLNPGERGFMPFKHDKLNDSLINVFVKWKSDGLLEK